MAMLQEVTGARPGRIQIDDNGYALVGIQVGCGQLDGQAVHADNVVGFQIRQPANNIPCSLGVADRITGVQAMLAGESDRIFSRIDRHARVKTVGSQFLVDLDHLADARQIDRYGRVTAQTSINRTDVSRPGNGKIRANRELGIVVQVRQQGCITDQHRRIQVDSNDSLKGQFRIDIRI